MTIKVYLSISHRTSTERNFLKHQSLLSDVLEYTQQSVQNSLGYGLAGILCPLDFPDALLPEVPRIELLCKGKYRHMELAALANETPSFPQEWTIILRPLRGWIQARRFAQFIKQLDLCQVPTVTSVVPLSSMGNPFWNCRYAPAEYEHGTHFLIPRTVEATVQTVDSSILKKSGTQDKNPLRSQDLSTLYRDDTALFATRGIQTSCVDERKTRPKAHIFYDEIDNICPWYFNLPIHELHGQSEVDLSAIDLHLKHFRNRENDSLEQNVTEARHG